MYVCVCGFVHVCNLFAWLSGYPICILSNCAAHVFLVPFSIIFVIGLYFGVTKSLSGNHS